jgi:thymidylate synthase (FAD)
MILAERTYLEMLKNGWSPQQARTVLPNSLKTEIVITANLREWRHIFTLRCSPKAHPQMKEIMDTLLKHFNGYYPAFFEDL